MSFTERIEAFRKYGIMLLLSITNLLYMHYYFLYRQLFEGGLFVYSILFNFISVCFDVSVMFLFFMVVTWKRIKFSLLLTYIVTLVWAFVNIVYGDFFDQYVSVSSLTQAGNMFNGLVVSSAIPELDIHHLYFVFSLIIYICLYKKIGRFQSNNKMLKLFIYIPLLSLIILFSSYSIYHFLNPITRNNHQLYVERIKDYIYAGGSEKNSGPNKLRFHVGCIRYLLSDLYDYYNPRVLTNEELCEVEKVVNDAYGKTFDNLDNPNIKNVVIVLLESFLSLSSDLIVDNKRITPFLDSLKHSHDVYYNGHVKSNITIGESGDGQFIYMTGLLPCRYKITIGEVNKHTYPALPKILKKEFGIKYAEIVIPTSPKIWMQDKMNVVYGFDNMYCTRDYIQDENGTLTDEQVFDMATKTNKMNNIPFLSMILSVSTHQPYNNMIDKSFIIKDNSLSESFRAYLNACHYVDKQLKMYFCHLKKIKQYDNTLICILADHQPNMDALESGEDLSPELPFYVVNGGPDIVSAYNGSCNQLDVFTTILDLLNVDSKWKGLGRSLLSPNYKDIVDSEMYRKSELIIEGDYFGNK